MAWENPKTDWNPSSVPKAGDFNRIEENIAELKSTKEPNITVLQVNRGGTGATTVAGARSALGLGYTDGPLPVAYGGTGASTVAGARSALGLGYTNGPLPVAYGGTGASTVAGARAALGLGYADGALPIANGGTGANNMDSARSNLGIIEFNNYFNCRVSTKGGKAEGVPYGSASRVNFRGLQIGRTVICSAFIYMSIDADMWLKIEASATVLSVVASVIKNDSNNFAPECVCYKSGGCAYITSDEGSSEGFMVTLTLSY